MYKEAMLTSVEQCQAGQHRVVRVWLPSATRQHSRSGLQLHTRMHSLVLSQHELFMLHLQSECVCQLLEGSFSRYTETIRERRKPFKCISVQKSQV